MTQTPDERSQLNIAITEETRTYLVAIKEAEGIPYAKQVEMAVRKWATEIKGLPLQPPRPKRR